MPSAPATRGLDAAGDRSAAAAAAKGVTAATGVTAPQRVPIETELYISQCSYYDLFNVPTVSTERKPRTGPTAGDRISLPVRIGAIGSRASRGIEFASRAAVTSHPSHVRIRARVQLGR